MAAGILKAMADAVRQAQTLVNEVETFGPAVAQRVNAFAIDHMAFRARTGMAGADPENPDPRPMLRALGFTLDWLD